MEEVEEIPGPRANSTYYFYDDHVFLKLYVNNEGRTLRCKIRTCPARLKIPGLHNLLHARLTVDHDHQVNPEVALIIRCRKILRDRALLDDTTPRIIYREEKLRFPEMERSIDEQTAINYVKGVRRRCTPPRPTSLVHAGQILQQQHFSWMAKCWSAGREERRGGLFFRELLHGANNEPIFVMKPPVQEIRIEALIVQVIPCGHQLHLLVVHMVSQENEYHPAGYTFFQATSVVVYERALRAILPLNMVAAAIDIISSFDVHLWQALRIILPVARLSGCPFFFAQKCLELSMIAAPQLNDAVMQNIRVKDAINRICAVTYLPPNLIEEGLATVTAFCRENELNQLNEPIRVVGNLLRDFQSTELSVHNLEQNLLLRNSHVETIAVAFLSLMGTPEGNFWRNYNKLRRYDFIQATRVIVSVGLTNTNDRLSDLSRRLERVGLDLMLSRAGSLIAFRTRKIVNIFKAERNNPWQEGGNHANGENNENDEDRDYGNEENEENDGGNNEENGGGNNEENGGGNNEENGGGNNEENGGVNNGNEANGAAGENGNDGDDNGNEANGGAGENRDDHEQREQENPRIPNPPQAVGNNAHGERQQQPRQGNLLDWDMPPQPLWNQLAPHLLEVANWVARQEDDPQVSCIICVRNRRNTELIPCGHYQLCDTCAEALNACPYCRAGVESKQRIFE